MNSGIKNTMLFYELKMANGVQYWFELDLYRLRLVTTFKSYHLSLLAVVPAEATRILEAVGGNGSKPRGQLSQPQACPVMAVEARMVQKLSLKVPWLGQGLQMQRPAKLTSTGPIFHLKSLRNPAMLSRRTWTLARWRHCTTPVAAAVASCLAGSITVTKDDVIKWRSVSFSHAKQVLTIIHLLSYLCI